MNYNLSVIFETVSDIWPDRLALIVGDQRLSYRELDQRANQLAHHLRSIGVGAGDHVGILAYNRSEWVESLLACFKIRAVPININYRYVDDELFYLFDNADISTLIFERSFAPLVSKISPELPKLVHCIVVDDGSEISQVDLAMEDYEKALLDKSRQRDFPNRSSDDRYMLYTGGTTGLPKGVVWRHQDIFFAALHHGDVFDDTNQFVTNIQENANPMITFSTAPMMHALGMWSAMLSFFAGGTFVLYSRRTFEPVDIWQVVERERVNVLLCVGDAMARPLAECLKNNFDRFNMSSLFAFGSGGAILSESVKDQIKSLLPNLVVYNSFGSSETGAGMSVADAEPEDAQQENAPRCVLGRDNKVFDPDMNEVVPGSGGTGILAKTGHIPLAYYKDEKKTAQTFKLDGRGRRWVMMGDYVHMAQDGSARFLGRGSVCINSGGEKIYPEEVETVLKGHPDVYDVAIVGVPHDRFTEAVTAVIQTRENKPISQACIDEFCRDKLARYKVPKNLVFVSSVLRTASAKPDYQALKVLATESLGLKA